MGNSLTTDRRGFLKTVGATSLIAATESEAAARPLTEKEKLDRIASNTWPIRHLFKGWPNVRPNRNGSTSPALVDRPLADKMKQKYGEITMLDFPQFTKDRFPGVTRMDLFSGLFGDVTDASMYVDQTGIFDGNPRTSREFDPSSASGKKWLERMAAKMASTGTYCQHISNNAPLDLCELDPALRRSGIEVAKKWIEGVAVLGAKSMRVNSGGPRVAPPAIPDPASGYPKNDLLAKYLTACIESFKEMADYGGKHGVRVTLENHWGLTANPINIRIVIDEVNHPYCEASPDFCNWEHEYLMYNALRDLAPYAHTNVHAKYWDRWGDNNDIQRSTRIMLAAGFRGTFALEYEAGPWDGVEGAQHVFKEVMAALSTPV
jgi:sugar phosphate isomerase/epimerase